MKYPTLCLLTVLLLLLPQQMKAQKDTRAYLYTGVVYDETMRPVPNAHVIAEGTGNGDVTDRNGIFQVYIRRSDLLTFYHIAINDTTVAVSLSDPAFSVVLNKRYHPLKEARIFEWGSTYEDLLSEARRQGTEKTLHEKLELPRKPPDYIPFDKDEDYIKSIGFLLNSPVSFLYHNFSKYEKSVRKAYRLEQDREENEKFNELVSEENLAYITGLQGEALQDFIIYVNRNMTKTMHDPEIEILTEIHALWKAYRKIKLPQGE